MCTRTNPPLKVRFIWCNKCFNSIKQEKQFHNKIMKKTGLCPRSRTGSLQIQGSLIPFICFLLNSVCFWVVVGADSCSYLPPDTQPSATGHPADRGGASPHRPTNWTHSAPPKRRVWPRKRWLRKENQRVSTKHGWDDISVLADPSCSKVINQ